MRYQDASDEIIQEYGRAASMHPAFHSAHEGYAVILEELDELWAEVRRPRDVRNRDRMRAEAQQVGAMALRFMVDLL